MTDTNDQMTDDIFSEKELNYKRANYFFEKKLIVHASLKSGKFYNGRIFEVGSDFIVIHDRDEGRQLVFFAELKRKLEEYQNKEESMMREKGK